MVNINAIKNFVVCLSHDVDRTYKSFQYLTHSLAGIKKKDFRSAWYHISSVLLKNHYWGFDRIIDIENKYNVKSTFFFLNESYPFKFFNIKSWKYSAGYYNIFDYKIQDIIKRLDLGGWEIGLHGSYNSYNDLNLLIKEKKLLEQITGHEIAGVRQHFLNLNHNTWDLQREAGFKYDSSFGFKDNVGFKDDKYNLFPLDDKYDFNIVPMAIMDACLMSKPDPYESALNLINIAEEKKGCLVLNWHQRVFNDNEFPGWGKIYIRIIEECKKRDADFLTIGGFVEEYGK
ncbi:MAG: polysaccharide deacetylase family protein [Spirochaetes bacterium]|jgi:peptidoglycan/xylan/chitin deacetylase (PgdA/CDA1 family)|nr:polysaccharide deacetylase family protein [Spirochaetota bacterium]